MTSSAVATRPTMTSHATDNLSRDARIAAMLTPEPGMARALCGEHIPQETEHDHAAGCPDCVALTEGLEAADLYGARYR